MSSSSTTGKKAPQPRAKDALLIAGTDVLLASRKPGQTFTCTEIGRACNLHPRTITFIERKAKAKLAHRLHDLAPDLFQILLGKRTAKEVLAEVDVDPMRSGRAAVRPKKVVLKHFKEVKDTGELGDTARIIRERRKSKQDVGVYPAGITFSAQPEAA